MSRCRELNEIAVVDTHKLLHEAGAIIPRDVRVIGDLRSEEGAVVEADD